MIVFGIWRPHSEKLKETCLHRLGLKAPETVLKPHILNQSPAKKRDNGECEYNTPNGGLFIFPLRICRYGWIDIAHTNPLYGGITFYNLSNIFLR